MHQDFTASGCLISTLSIQIVLFTAHGGARGVVSEHAGDFSLKHSALKIDLEQTIFFGFGGQNLVFL